MSVLLFRTACCDSQSANILLTFASSRLCVSHLFIPYLAMIGPIRKPMTMPQPHLHRAAVRPTCFVFGHLQPKSQHTTRVLRDLRVSRKKCPADQETFRRALQNTQQDRANHNRLALCRFRLWVFACCDWRNVAYTETSNRTNTGLTEY